MKVEELIKKGRLIPDCEWDKQGNFVMVGYRRKGNSKKSKQRFTLKQPRILKAAEKPPAEPSLNLPLQAISEISLSPTIERVTSGEENQVCGD